MNAASWQAGFAARIRPLLQRMQAGEDVPPALWHRAEGFAEAGLASGAIDAHALATLIDTHYCEITGSTTAALFGEASTQWIDAQGGVRLRFRMPRAPVFPGSA